MGLERPEPDTTLVSVRFEHREDALGIGTPEPRLSWQVRTDDPAWRQTAYEVELDGGTTAHVDCAEQVLVPWPFAPLASRSGASVRIRVACGTRWSDWSATATVETGLLRPDDWTARFITPHRHGALDAPAPELVRTVVLREDVVSARLYATSHGVYTASLNGTRVGDEILAPGWTSYRHRLRYQTHDVTALLRKGENTLSAVLGNGWYRGHLGWWGARALYGDRLALLAQLEVRYADGSVEVFGTDEQWRARDSGILADDLYKGQRTDLRFTPGEADGPVEVLSGQEADLARLVAPEGPPVRVTEVLPASKVWQSPSGRTLVDFGQNIVGWVRLRVRDTTAGAEVVVRHSEVLEDEELCTRPLRTADAIDTYLLADAEETVLEPSLRTNGFRIATGFVGTPLMTDALTCAGHPELAHRLLLEKGCPSWLYPVTMGATTVWERWDSLLPDGTVNPSRMTSFNHYALGAVADWMHRTVAGLAPAAPGCREILVRPLPHRSLTHATAVHLTPYGEASVGWRREDGRFHLNVVVPAGTRATVHLPGSGQPPVTVAHGTHTWSVGDPCPAPAPSEVVTVRDLMDEPGLWAHTVAALTRQGLGTTGPAAGALPGPGGGPTAHAAQQGPFRGRRRRRRHRSADLLSSAAD
ncbi:family 78 glycoside hydrolase catalytic domain [Streptomyces europaeiscabiei]|uniref:family 78 glycoside hydrolase catalytic domain n=1 Tax=Streptomyces europaeiscabiei TaxID=146819 RepID=UPI0029B6D6A1|nr:family 78 glycoside hydrolase catalytic domain [Streptomyces europaeiscabiei]MDX3696974.1 family 78 glycoside hydrolase catalytic domain [Streptomyces europaeiscabiei]